MKRAAVLFLVLGAVLFPGAAKAIPSFGCPLPLQAEFVDHRSCYETQWWGLNGASLPAPANAPFDSSHMHLMIAYPIGETIIPVSGSYEFPFYAQLHNFQGGNSNFVRGGNFLSGGDIPQIGWEWRPTSVDESRSGTLRKANSGISCSKCENRFTLNGNAPFGGRSYQSGAWWTFRSGTPGPVSMTARGWSQAGDYVNITIKDSNLGSGTGFRTSYFRDQCVPDPWTITYSLAQGATHAFFYLNPNLHAGSKGIVVVENKTGSSGTVNIPRVLAPGTHKLMFGAWEKAGNIISAGVGTHSFRVC